MNVRDRIQQLKEEKGAVVLAHNYCLDEVQEIADFVGDSLALSIKASEVTEPMIIFCGVTFMAESAKILNPDKKVIMPEGDAVCPMANMCSASQLEDAKQARPGAKVVGYVNTSAASKAKMDICCTSANAVKVIESLKGEEVIFVPDQNLGAYVAEKAGVPMHLWEGFCPTHQAFTPQMVEDMKAEFPGAVVMAHPECRMEVLEMADMVGSTSQMLAYAADSKEKEFIVLTERGLLHRLRRDSPLKKFHVPEVAVCPPMKMTDQRSVLKALENEGPEVELDEEVLKAARRPLERMISLR